MDDADSNLSSSARAATRPAGFDFPRALARQWRDSVRYFGFWRTLRELAGALGRAMIELLPSRRKARFGDLDYDLDHEVDTTRANVNFRTQLLAELAGRSYFASEPWLFDEMMQALPINFPDFTFVDLGSGKGRALLMAASYGFKKIIGVEFMPEWHRAAEENIRKLAAGGKISTQIKSLCMDARDFEFPAAPLVVYLFNPFAEATFAAVLKNLRSSIVREPRAVYIVYRFPELEQLLAGSPWLEKVAGMQQWTVYKATG
jgi:SAM-dependent methyltransferase